MTVIDKIKDPAPIFTRTPHPEIFKTTLDQQKYWAKQKKYWIEGYNEDVNGMLYHYCMEVKLKDRVRGTIQYPTARDGDVLMSQLAESCMKDGYIGWINKGRGVGLSSFFMTLPLYFNRVYPNSKSIATSKDKKTLAALFNEKTVIGLDEMHSTLKPDIINKNQTANESYLKTGYKYINDDGEIRYSENEFVCRDTQESDKATTNFSGMGAIYGFADEAMLMPRLMKFLPSARECFFDHSQNRMVGLLMCGGTMEESVDTESVKRIQEVWTNSEALRIRTLFIPATYGKYMTNGHSNHDKAREEILKRRDELDKLEDKSQLTAYIKNNPLTIEEIFNFSSGGLFDEYTVEKVNAQIRELPKVKDLPVPHKILISKDAAISTPTTTSPILILEQPKQGVDYIIGGDTIMTSDLTSSAKTNSKYAAIVTKGIDPQADLQFCPVATYMERPKSIEHANIQVINLLKLYNTYGRAKIMCELNAGAENLLQMIINEGLSKCIMLRKDLSKSGWVDKSKPWFYRADQILRWQIEAGNIYFKKYAHLVFFKDLLIDATKGENDNTDILDAFLAALYGWGSGDILSHNIKKREVRKIKMVKYVMVDGKMTPEWYDKEIRT
jgi:hypothetical protein